MNIRHKIVMNSYVFGLTNFNRISEFFKQR